MYIGFQILTAIILLIVVYILVFKLIFSKSRVIYKTGEFNVYPNNNSVYLFEGIMPMSTNNAEFNTYNQKSPNFIYIPHPSNTHKGGYTYSFWMNTGSNSLSSLDHNIIFMKGINKYYQIKENTTDKEVVLVKAPLLRFKYYDDTKTIGFVMEFNSLNQVHNEWEINPEILNIMASNRWSMYSFVFRDDIDKYKIKIGMRIDFYIDNKLVTSYTKRNDNMKNNNGNIYICPTIDTQNLTSYDNCEDNLAGGCFLTPKPTGLIKNGYIADFKYFNYALDINDIDTEFMKGYKQHSYVTPKTIRYGNIMNDYKIMSLYNETHQIKN